MDQKTQPAGAGAAAGTGAAAGAGAAAAAASHAAAAAAAAAAQPDYLRVATAPRSHVAPPRFFEEDPVIWLVQLDLFFSQAAVDDELSRFRIAATLLPGHLLRDFTDILRNPPQDRPYTILSDAIRQRFGKSVEQRLRCLLSGQQLGDRRPFHLQDLMSQLLTGITALTTSVATLVDETRRRESRIEKHRGPMEDAMETEHQETTPENCEPAGQEETETENRETMPENCDPAGGEDGDITAERKALKLHRGRKAAMFTRSCNRADAQIARRASEEELKKRLETLHTTLDAFMEANEEFVEKLQDRWQSPVG
ncbi:hypothetical protein FJT64_001958 [Amphibalanus amphitrite]|uniref:DUF7041 domain-containing protein n=1 Tax=Amphibalanus amphitrite TaxID=1232801 RepID=A0A6A4X463_AMPAM|nr:hypothetical protein FJT64_001958 [Amphibalanus amphitrite]